MQKLDINEERLWRSLMDLAAIGATPKGGNCRLALTALDAEARSLVVGWMRACGLTVTIDGIGNIFARKPGRRDDLPAVATGSHIDTQPTGGRFDGCYGVLAGLEVMRTLQDKGIETDLPLEVAIWTNEEGSRFVPVMMGSGVFAGQFSTGHALGAVDADGISVREALARIRHDIAPAGEEHAFSAYLEAHIEQGPVLEDQRRTIGVVSGSLGSRWFDIQVKGMEAHAGPTPMHLRRDALYAAAQLMQRVVDIALEHQPNGRGTVGVARVHPGSRNVIPGRVSFTADLRHEDAGTLDRMDRQWRDACAEVQSRLGVEVEVTPVQSFEPTAFDCKLVDQVRTASGRRGYAHMDIVSGAGHDAVYVARVAPTAMIFVPCKDGISHNEIEYAEPEHLAAGCNVLLDVMLERAVG
jgi:N-carbamoyl-L-amino-acid hydrolase